MSRSAPCVNTNRIGLLATIGLLIAITTLAAFLRLYRIDTLPPGDGYDPAIYGLDALAILQGERPIYLPTNYGREALYSYLVAACVLILGVGPHAVYTASAIVGILTVPAVYLAAEEMFSSEKGALARFGGLLAALATALSYWHLSWSRLGVRAILVPFFAAMTAYWLWRGLRTASRWAFIACGFFLGLSIYTYQAARLLPLLVLSGFAYVSWSRRSFSGRNRRPFTGRDLAHLFLVFVVATIVYAPLGYYFVTHPGISSVRIEQTLVVSPSQDLRTNARRLLEQLGTALSVLFIRGGKWLKVNPPGRPALNPFFSLAFLLGTAISLARIKRPNRLFTLTWIAIMTAPAILAHHGPTTKRAIGAIPAAMMLIAIGCLESWDEVRRWTDKRRSVGRQPPWTMYLSVGLAVLIAIGFAYSGARTYLDYFGTWARNPALFTYFEAGLSATGQYIARLPPQESIYLTSVSPEHPSVLFNSKLRSGVKGFNGRVCMVVVDRMAHDATYVVVPAEDEYSLRLLEEYLPQGQIVDQGPLHYQLPYFYAYRVPAGTQAQVRPSHPRDANWVDTIQLLGYDLEPSSYVPGDTLHLTLYFRALRAMDQDYTVFTHLLGPQNPASGTPLWAQEDSEPCKRSYRTSSWDPGEIVIDHFALRIPPDAPSGEYEIAMGFYEWRTLERLPLLDASGQIAGDIVTLGRIHLPQAR